MNTILDYSRFMIWRMTRSGRKNSSSNEILYLTDSDTFDFGFSVFS